MNEETESDNAVVRWSKHHWLFALFIVLSVAGLGSYLLFQRGLKLSDAENGANGLALGVWGLLLSVVGFAFTFWQLAQTKTAARAAADAVKTVRSRVATYDAIVETSRAVALVRETQRHLRIKNWDSALASYHLSREALVRLIELPSSIGEHQRTRLSSTLADIKAISSRIESGLIKGSVSVDVSRALKESQEHEELMTTIAIALQREII